MVSSAPESVPVLRTPSFSSFSQLLEALGCTPHLHSVLEIIDGLEHDLRWARGSDHFSDTLAAAPASIDINTTNAATLEFAPDKGLPPPPSTLPLSLPVKSSQPMSTQAPALTQRRDALLELLTSERAYLSDLALIRDVYMRLASGGHPSRSRVSEPPLAITDVRIIFRNISDLAVLSDTLIAKLEKAIEEEGNGVGEVFLEVVPLLALPYTTYITAHPRALAHLNTLSSPPQLTSQFSRWLKESKELVEAYTHACDLPSLLIKPAERLPVYGLLLGALINATPEPLVIVTQESESIGGAFGKLREGSEGLAKLKEAKRKVEEVARTVNEGRRRVKVVRDVLEAGHAEDGGGQGKVASIGILEGGVINASVSRMLSLGIPKPSSNTRLPSKHKGIISTPETDPDPEHAESALLVALDNKLNSHLITLSNIAHDALTYAESLRMLFGALVNWARAFASVIGVSINPEFFPQYNHNDHDLPTTPPPEFSGTGQSESFDAFSALCTGVVELAQELELQLRLHILPSLQSLEGASVAPLKLLSALHTLHPLHQHLQHLPTLGERLFLQEVLPQASQSYVALRGQLALELPVYVRLLEKGVDGVVLDLGRVMEAFWEVARERWTELFDALGMGEEGLEAGDKGYTKRVGRHSGGETVHVWRERWKKVSGVLSSLVIINPPPKIGRPRSMMMPNSTHSAIEHPPGQEEEDGGSVTRRLGLDTNSTDSCRPSLQRRQSSSVLSFGALSASTQTSSYYTADISTKLSTYTYSTPPTPTRTSLLLAPTQRNAGLQSLCTLYKCAAFHACMPPQGVSYRGLPFLEIRLGDTFDVLREYGRPNTHPDIPILVDDGEDCLLLVREVVHVEGLRSNLRKRGKVGWALASFLMPLD